MTSVPTDHFDEKHFRPQDLAAKWGISVAAVRDLFRANPEVVHYGKPVGGPKKRGYTTLLIPESVAKRVYMQMVGRER